MIWRPLMIGAVSAFVLLSSICVAVTVFGATAPVNVTVSQEIINVTIDDGVQTVTITVPEVDIVQVVSPGEQGIPGAAGTPGSPGGRGYDGREIEVQNSGTYIQWRYIADPPGTWANLAAIASLTGANGINGLNGKTVLSGSGAPSNSLGVDGDFYIDLPLAHFYGPKASGVWPAYIDLIGPAGPPGPSVSVTQSAVIGALDDPTDGAVVLLQQGPTEAASAAKLAVADKAGNTKTWLDSTGALVRQCLSGETGYAVKVLSYTGEVLYSVTCNNSIVFKGSFTIL